MSILRYRPRVVEKTPVEGTLLALARNGGAPFSEPNKDEIDNLVDDINSRKVSIHIPWFWRHDFVLYFSETQIGRLDVDSLMYIIYETETKCLDRDIHWIEKINLFHLYGLCRIAGKSPPIGKIISMGLGANDSLSFSILSARNSELIAKGADAKDAIHSINYMHARKIERVFAEYQLYYYDGINNLLKKLTNYVATDKESIVPTTIYALFKTFEIDRELEVSLQDKVLSRLSPDVIKLVKK